LFLLRQCHRPPALGAGRGRDLTTSPPGQPRDERRLARRPVLFVNPVVSHTRITHLRGFPRPHGCRIAREVMWHSPQNSFKWRVARGCSGRTSSLRDAAGRRPREEPPAPPDVRSREAGMNPYGSQSFAEEPARVSRRETPRPRATSGNPSLVQSWLWWCRRPRRPRADRGGPIGVVKLLRARGGCLGVIRFGRGRLRKVRGSCPTSVEPGMPEQPGELKHLSTWRRGNQPRLPQ
jgi:hypothetical protein